MSSRSRIPSERSFGLSVGCVSAAAGALLIWRGYASAGSTLATVGILLVGAGVLAPSALRGLNRVWWRFAQRVGWINARILLTLLFFVVLTPVGFLMRLFDRNPLRSVCADTNWSDYGERRRDSRHYEHLY